MAIKPKGGNVPASKSIKPYLNIDKCVMFGLRAAYQAMNGWLRGRPLEEVALMNRIMEKLCYNECKPWRKPPYSPYNLDRNIFILHRQGDGNTDAYGSDFAVTVNVFNERPWPDAPNTPSLFSKTALFQLKTGDNNKPVLIKDQLTDTKGVFANRSFVLHGNQKTGEYRVQAVKPLLAKFGKQETKTFDVTERQWLSLSEWLVQWLTCKQGIFSSDLGRRRVAGKLAQFYIRPETVDAQSREQRLITAFISDSQKSFDEPIQQQEGNREGDDIENDDSRFAVPTYMGLGVNGPITWLVINVFVNIPEEPSGG